MRRENQPSANDLNGIRLRSAGLNEPAVSLHRYLDKRLLLRRETFTAQAAGLTAAD